MQKTKIEWTDYVWNPIKGICPVRCKLPDGRIYCYGRKIYKRFKRPPKLSWDGRIPILSNKKPSRIFVCSTIEIFHPQIPKEWRDTIFTIIEADYNKKHTFQILTKFPHLVDRPMPDNVWLGVSITGNSNDDFMRASYFGFLPRKAKIQFISYEPLLEMPSYNIPHVDWIIIGKLTRHGHKYDPKREWIEKIISSEEAKSKPIFLKDNLKEIWGEPLIQEMPK